MAGAEAPKAAAPAFDWRKAAARLPLVPWRRPYSHPAGRAHFILAELKDFLAGRLLDVGGGSAALVFKEHLGERYYALDLDESYTLGGRREGAHDSVVNLEEGRLPFPDQSFDTVICTDVLEHLDNIYSAYDELFRVARRFVIISLPNNWPTMLASFLAGHNITHRAGYGLPPRPKPPGQRHKYFFNLEEACDFLVGRIPEGFAVRRVELRFEHGTDGFVFMPPVANFFRRLRNSTLASSVAARGAAAGAARWLAGRAVYVPLRSVDFLLSILIWGWGSRVRFYNLFCRQAWVVFERDSRARAGGG